MRRLVTAVLMGVVVAAMLTSDVTAGHFRRCRWRRCCTPPPCMCENIGVRGCTFYGYNCVNHTLSFALDTGEALRVCEIWQGGKRVCSCPTCTKDRDNYTCTCCDLSPGSYTAIVTYYYPTNPGTTYPCQFPFTCPPPRIS